MSYTKNDIAQLAVGNIGSSAGISDISSLRTKAEKILNLRFALSLTTLLEAHDWGFATGYEALALVEEDPMESWKYSYRPSADVLKIRRIARENEFYHELIADEDAYPFQEIYDPAGTVIYAGLQDAWAEYTRNLSADINFPNHFADGLAWQLAMDTAPQIITNNYSKVARLLLEDAKAGIEKAIAADFARKPAKKTPHSRFVRARM